MLIFTNSLFLSIFWTVSEVFFDLMRDVLDEIVGHSQGTHHADVPVAQLIQAFVVTFVAGEQFQELILCDYCLVELWAFMDGHLSPLDSLFFYISAYQYFEVEQHFFNMLQFWDEVVFAGSAQRTGMAGQALQPWGLGESDILSSCFE